MARLLPSGPPASPLGRLAAERGATLPTADLLALDAPGAAPRARPAKRARPRRAPRGAAVAGRLAYLDTSAYVKLALAEPERDALWAELGRRDAYVASALLSVEGMRACGRYGPEYAAQARIGLAGLALLPVDEAVMSAAANLEPGSPRTLDAAHLATALSIGPDLAVLIAYDQRLVAAASEHEIPTVAAS